MPNLANAGGVSRALASCLAVLSLGQTASRGDARSGLAGRRPNVILILTDDQGYGDLARNGNPVIKTPHIDRFYDEGVRFEDFQVSPTCAPTRCSIFTGRHEFKSGVTHTIHERERMSLKATTLAEVLKSAGYATGIFGKWHLGDEEAYQPQRRGFDEVFIHGAGGIGQTFPGSCGDAPGNSYFSRSRIARAIGLSSVTFPRTRRISLTRCRLNTRRCTPADWRLISRRAMPRSARKARLETKAGRVPRPSRQPSSWA